MIRPLAKRSVLVDLACMCSGVGAMGIQSWHCVIELGQKLIIVSHVPHGAHVSLLNLKLILDHFINNCGKFEKDSSSILGDKTNRNMRKLQQFLQARRHIFLRKISIMLLQKQNLTHLV